MVESFFQSRNSNGSLGGLTDVASASSTTTVNYTNGSCLTPQTAQAVVGYEPSTSVKMASLPGSAVRPDLLSDNSSDQPASNASIQPSVNLFDNLKTIILRAGILPAEKQADITPVNIGTLPPGGSVTIKFRVTINSPLVPANTGQVSNQGTVTSSLGSQLTDDPAKPGAADPTVTLIPHPDLTADMTNSVSGSTSYPTGWIWDIRVSNEGTKQVSFADGQTILSDQLPSDGLTYGTVTTGTASGVTGSMACAVSGADLTCTANGAVSIAQAGHFTVSIPVTPTAAGSYFNPRSAEGCRVDPSDHVVELSEANNDCADIITVNQPPSITSADHASFTLNTSGSFTITTSEGYPTDTTISLSGSLPDGVSFADNSDGTATISGTATDSGTFSVDLTASNGITPDATQTFVLTVNAPPAFTSAGSTYFLQGTAGTFTFTASGYPAPTISLESATPALPSGVTFNGATGVLSGTAGTGSEGVYTLSMRAANGVSPDATQSFTLTIGSAPTISSADHSAFTAGTADQFDITTTGLPVPAITQTGSLPSGITFTDHGDGTAQLSGTAASGAGGQYPLTFEANNGILPNASQNFTLTVNQTPAFTSSDHSTLEVGAYGSITFTASGYPDPDITIEAGSSTLPSGITYNATTHELSGTPAVGTQGVYTLYLKAANTIGTDALQTFTFTVNEAPVFTSADVLSIETGQTQDFSITTSGRPIPAITRSGSLPTGVSFTDNGDGSATLHCAPVDGAGGQYPLTFTANNGLLPNATQNFTLTVNEAPEFTSADHTAMQVGAYATFSVTTNGYPTASITLDTGAASLPAGISFNPTAHTLEGTPDTGANGVYTLSFRASNMIGSDATQTFTLTVNEAPAITSSAPADATVGSQYDFTFTTSGYPTPTLSISGSLPNGISFTDGGTGTANLHGTPANGSGGIYPITVTASNGVLPNSVVNINLIVNEAPEFTSASSTDFVVGTASTFTFTVDGYPTSTIHYTSTPALPASLSMVGGILRGTPVSGDAGEYHLTVRADNGTAPDAEQSFTLRIGQEAGITSPNQVRFIAGRANTFTIESTGTPTPAISFTGGLPSTITLVDNGDGTATLSGSPLIGEAGLYPLTLTASNGVGADETQNFTLIIEAPAAVYIIRTYADTGDDVLSEDEHTRVGIQTIDVYFNKRMDTSSVLDEQNITLVMNGAVPITISSATYDSGLRRVRLYPDVTDVLLPGDYVLTVKSGLLDENGFSMGADFVRTFHVDTTAPALSTPTGVSLPDGTVIVDGATLNDAVNTIDVTFTEDVKNPAGDTQSEDVTNPLNYMLVRPGLNGSFDTTQCDPGLAGDDIELPVGPVTYSNGGGSGPFRATVTVGSGSPLENGTYRLFVCGTTSISDLAGNHLNDGVDETRTFTVLRTSVIRNNPATGFAPGLVTVLPDQTVAKAYLPQSGLWIEIPTLDVQTTVTGVPIDGSQWNLTWLGGQIGWLEGTAAPTWAGNTVLTAHAYTADGLPGPFARLKDLKYGEQIILHADGQKYIYEVKSRDLVLATDTTLLTQHEEMDWLTLITCQTYDARTQTYLYRTAVRAVLVKVEAE